MNIETARALYAYNCWAHARVWTCAAQLSPAQWVQETGYSFNTIRAQYIHVYDVDRRWFARLGGLEVPPRTDADAFMTRDALFTAWQSMEAIHQSMLAGMNDADMARVIEYDMPHRGGMKRNTGWEIVAHVVNHGTDHRAQILAMLHMLGAETTEHDLMFYLWER